MSGIVNSNECVQVFVRCRPLFESEKHLPIPIEVHAEVNKIISVGGNKSAVKTFSFDKVFAPETEQAVIYDNVAAPLIKEVLMGFNCTILAYGQTGTGKTFTIEGNKCSKLNDNMELQNSMAGIIPRSMKQVFQQLTDQKCDFEVSISFLELYNEEIYDLLSKSDDLTKLKLYDCASPKGSVIVQGLEVRTVKCMKDVNDVLDQGYKKRRKAATLLNKMSSRSHTVFTVTVKMKEEYSTMEMTKTGKLNLVDLAGSENIGRSGAVERRAREAGNINQSLLALGRVITALCENATHIPYRESKLTRLLRDSLGGQTKTAIIATISPSALHLDETLNTLEYALRAKSIANKPEINAQVCATALTKDYLEKIYLLKEQMREMSASKSFQVDPDNLEYLEASIERNTNEIYNELEMQEQLYGESQELDENILAARETLNQKKMEWKKIISDQDELSKKLEKVQEEIRSEEILISILDPVLNKMHGKLHKILKQKEDITNEVKKEEEKASEALSENRLLEKRFSMMRCSQSSFNEALMKFQNQLQDDIRVAYNRNLNEGLGCQAHLSSLKNTFDSFMESSEKFSQLHGIISDLEKTKNDFHENLLNALEEEKGKIHEHQSEIENSIGSLDVCKFDSLRPLLNNCDDILKGMHSSLMHWRNELIKEITNRDQILNDYISNQEAKFQSLIESWKDVVNKHNERLRVCNEILVGTLSQEDASKKKWESHLTAAENVITSLQELFTENMTNDLEKNELMYNRLQELAHDEINNIKSLSEFCESSISTVEEFKKEMAVSSSDNLNDMMEITNDALRIYKDIFPNFASCINESKISDEFCKGMEERIIEDKERRKELPAITSCIQNFKGKLESINESCSTIYSEYQADLTTIETDKVKILKDLQDSFNRLHDHFSRDVSENINAIEAEKIQGTFNVDMLSAENTSACEGTSHLDTTFTLLEGDGCIENESGCIFCKDKEDIFLTKEESAVPTNSSAVKIKSSASKGFRSGKNKEISQPDPIEKLCEYLLSSNWDDQPSSDCEKTDKTV
ncbi:kinesin-like protein KIF11 [Nephila pilipes]|uniref:Kinesin-like protein KIF11 n=1 Tax=Nephila pilipes TaxID=299642 RepID=A0A8X6U2Z3_NEPPI|nr:kinesin-like protein KIF11 [Nephila pilipes]